MKTSSRNLGIIIIIAIIIIIGAIFLVYSASSQKQTVTVTTATKPQSPSTTKVAIPTASAGRYSAEERAKIRADFVDRCVNNVGQSHKSECVCAADYLATHYTETQLVSLYLKYHLSGNVPPEVKTAADACSSK
jgi:hypothetical protein